MSTCYQVSHMHEKKNKRILIMQKIATITFLDAGCLKPRPNALDFSLYMARQMSSIVECSRERVAKRSRLFTRLGTQHSIDVLLDHLRPNSYVELVSS